VGSPVLLQDMVRMVHDLQDLDNNNVTKLNQTLVLKQMKKNVLAIQPPPISEWTDWMKLGARDKLIAEVTQYLEQWKREGREIDAGSLHMFYQDFMQMIFFVLQVKGLQAHKVFSTSSLTEKPDMALRSLTSLQEWVQYVIEVAMNHIHRVEGSLSIVEKVKQFITENIELQCLSREDVANHVFLNPDYLTRVFKRETGMSISDYLQQQRIECAKGLLMKTAKSVSDIALTSGYSNLSYFSTIFKKATQMNPIDYRKYYQKL
jgi:two-component system response regulator YesN